MFWKTRDANSGYLWIFWKICGYIQQIWKIHRYPKKKPLFFQTTPKKKICGFSCGFWGIDQAWWCTKLLKNDGLRQWAWDDYSPYIWKVSWKNIVIPNWMENNPFMFQSTNKNSASSYFSPLTHGPHGLWTSFFWGLSHIFRRSTMPKFDHSLMLTPLAERPVGPVWSPGRWWFCSASSSNLLQEILRSHQKKQFSTIWKGFKSTWDF